ncbi:MAG: alpha/beta hydrolase [Gammaproteobacteria bacterium]|nr:alpha/beta hydrolase [Gammaproteobacteria bacterium]
MSSILLISIALLCLFALGPRIRIDTDVSTPTIPDDVESYINDSEALVANLRPGCEKKIVWADPEQKQQTEFCVVYLHGFSATRQEVAPLCDELAESIGANLFYARLSGHGRDAEAMREMSVNRLLQDGVEALVIGRCLGKKIIIVANSTGATLGYWLALHHGSGIHRLIFLSPNFGLYQRSSELLLLPWGKLILYLLVGKHFRYEPQNALQARYWSCEFPSVAMLSMMGLIKLARRSAIDKVKQPLLLLYSPSDGVLNVSKIERYALGKGEGYKKVIQMPSAGSGKSHVLAGDILAPNNTEKVKQAVLDFLRELQNSD